MESSKIKGLCYAAASLSLLLLHNRYMKQKKHDVGWEEYIPSEIWLEIGKRLDKNLDIVRFRMVCKKFHSCLPSPTLFPLFVPSPPGPGQIDTNMSYFITEHNTYFDHTKKVCVMTKVDHLGKTRANINVENHPLILSQPIFSQIHSYHGLLAHHTSSHSEACSEIDIVQDLVLISPDIEDGVHPSFARQSHLTAVILYSDSGRLALLRLRIGSLNWNTTFCTQVFIHIVAYKGKLCALENSGNVYWMDYESGRMTQICEAFDPSIATDLLYLRLYVSHCGLIYLLRKVEDGVKRPGYKLDFLLKKWVYDEWIN